MAISRVMQDHKKRPQKYFFGRLFKRFLKAYFLS
jgi:hypothetical protein